jgi:hypothetical protein
MPPEVPPIVSASDPENTAILLDASVVGPNPDIRIILVTCIRIRTRIRISKKSGSSHFSLTLLLA